jgi:hypothetical protein
LAKAAAGNSGEASLLQGERCRVSGTALDQSTPKDDDQHLKIVCLFNENVLLCGEKPEQVTAPDLIMAITQQIGSGTARDEIQLKLRVVMPPVRTRRVGITPRTSIEIFRELKSLQHDDKK